MILMSSLEFLRLRSSFLPGSFVTLIPDLVDQRYRIARRKLALIPKLTGFMLFFKHQLTATAISTRNHRIPSDLRGQAGKSPLSTTIW